MLKKGEKVAWTKELVKSFQAIKGAIKEAPTITSPDYSKTFQLFTFSSFHTIVEVLLQNNDEGFEQPIPFFRKSLQSTKLKYDATEKQAYALVKAIKNFRPYFIGDTIVAYVPTTTVKDIFTQQETTGFWCRWINKIQEFNIDIQITKWVRGQGLAKLMAEKNLEANQINQVEHENVAPICDMQACGWYKRIVEYLQAMQCPEGMPHNEKRTLKLQEIRYVIIDGELWWRNLKGLLLRCVDGDKAKDLLIEMHKGACGGHYMAKTTTHKILREGFWWPTVFKYAHRFVKKCDACQRFIGKLKFSGNLPLRPVLAQAPF